LRSGNGEHPGKHRAVRTGAGRPFRLRLRDPFRQVRAPVRSIHRLSGALPQAYSFSSSPFDFFDNYTPAREKVNPRRLPAGNWFSAGKPHIRRQNCNGHIFLSVGVSKYVSKLLSADSMSAASVK